MNRIRSTQSPWRWLISLSILTVVGLTVQQVDLQAADGALDPTFGSGGKVIVGLNSSTSDVFGPKLAIQADGRIIVASAPRFSPLALSLIRFFSDGSIDPTFATVPVPGLRPVDLAIQPDGKIVVLASHALVRFNSNGSLDTSFEGGRVNFHDNFFGRAIAIQSDGKIVLVTSHWIDSVAFIRVDRINPDGTQDFSFSTLDTSLDAPDAFGKDVVIQADGRIVILGSVYIPEANFVESVLLRCNTDGSLDPSFGNGGVVISNHGGGFHRSMRVALQGDGKIVVTGVHTFGTADLKDFLLARYEVDGSLDASFGDGGVVISSLGNAYGGLRALAIQQDGKILVAGGDGQPAMTQFGLKRFTTSGSLDLSFGSFGRVLTSIGEGPANRWANDLAIQPDGAIVVVGSIIAGGTNKTAIVRYQNGTPHAPKFFLHGYASGTADGLTMSQTAPPPEALQASEKPQSWYSEPVLNGTLLEGATLQFVHPCASGTAGPMTISVAMTSEDGRDEQPLGQVAAPGSARCQLRTITIPVMGRTTLANRRLKLTIASSPSAPLKLSIGSGTFLRATNFEGTP